MERINEVIKLMAKTGLFFASADGIYQKQEREYIENYVHSMEQIGSLSDELKDEVYSALDKTYKMDEILDDTNKVLDGFSRDERRAILASLEAFIEKVITIDGELHPLEKMNFMRWKSAFGIN